MTTPLDPLAAGNTGTTGGSGTTTTTPSADYTIIKKSFTSDLNWPADLKLDRVKSNWHEWDRRLHFIADQRGFGSYLRGSLPKPNATTCPKAAQGWENNNLALRGFILEHISDNDYDSVKKYDNSHDVYKKLCSIHENQGLYAQIKLIKEALATQFVPGTPLSCTIDQIIKLHSRFIKMGPICYVVPW